MTAQTETRRLAAVMFADIEGYTALFQRNEAIAIQQVNDHRKDLEQATQKYKGEIIQFYGDGSATIFDSVIDAVHCAIDIQSASTKNRIPVRIGIHMGDLIVKDGDIFGDVVNIASRIQSAGVPGSILVSRKVVDELVNHPDVHTARIGMFSLKNVNKRIELFAVAERGLAIPPMHIEEEKRKFSSWYYLFLFILVMLGLAFWFKKGWIPFGNKKIEAELICIPPFKDHTQHPEFKETGIIVASLVSKGLNEISEANVVSYESLIRYFNSDLTPLLKNPFLAKRTGAKLSLDGHYRLTGEKQDSLFFWGDVIDLRTKEIIIHLPSVTCAANKDYVCIAEIVNYLAGFWKTRDTPVFKIPKGKAWDAYRRAIDIWGDEQKEQEAYSYLLQSIEEDSTFLDAYFLLLDYFNNANLFTNEADTLNLIRNRFPKLDERQANFLQYYEEDLKGRNTDAFKYFSKEYNQNPKDLMINTSGMVLASEYLNDPALTLSMFREIGTEDLDLNVCVYCRTKINMALQAYLDLSDLNNAGKLAEQLKPYAVKRAQVSKLILYYLTVGDTSTINDLIRNSNQRDTIRDIRQIYYRYAAQYALLLGKPELTHYYSNKALALYGNEANWKAGWCHFLVGNYTRAEQIYLAEVHKRPNTAWLIGDLGIIYAKQGKTEKANEIISKLENLKEPYDYGETPYLQGRIKANMGDTSGAIHYLDQAIEEGIKFGKGTTFHHDPALIPVFSNEEFVKLLSKNRPGPSNK
jgi:class 3 adenylate cyclase